MSYCRFSSDNFKSDVYCYESSGEFYQIHVATNRIIEDIPPLDLSLKSAKREESTRKHNEALRNCTHKPIGLSFDGESFAYDTLEETCDKLIELKKMGYNVPNSAFMRIDYELTEGKIKKLKQ